MLKKQLIFRTNLQTEIHFQRYLSVKDYLKKSYLKGIDNRLIRDKRFKLKDKRLKLNFSDRKRRLL